MCFVIYYSAETKPFIFKNVPTFMHLQLLIQRLFFKVTTNVYQYIFFVVCMQAQDKDYILLRTLNKTYVYHRTNVKVR